MGMVQWWGISALEGHALSWPDATERVPPKANRRPLFPFSTIPLFLFPSYSLVYSSSAGGGLMSNYEPGTFFWSFWLHIPLGK
jgi:hypothetical protein